MEYPIFNSKSLSVGDVYDLADSTDRLKYFHAKLGSKIEEVKMYLETGSFVGYMLAKKLAGKGTYAKMMGEILGPDRFAHISVGDVVRKYHTLLENPDDYTELRAYFQKNYRGILSVDDAINALLNRTQDKVSIPTDFLLALLKREINSLGKRALFIDGLPRNMDQISSSLYFRDLINYREDPDFFILIESPLEVLNARIKHRRVCPQCHTSKNMLFNPTEFVKYDNDTRQFYLICDNKHCSGYGKSICVSKEGDEVGIKSIEQRLKDDQHLMDVASNLQGIEKILVKSSVPIDEASQYFEEYEIQQAINYSLEGDKVNSSKSSWVFKDDNGVDSVTMYAATFVVNIFNQIHKILTS